MLNTHDAVPMIAVKDLAVARRFYEQTLGLAVVNAGEHVTQMKTGKTPFNLYVSSQAGTNKATALTWEVDDELTAIVAELRGKKVPFLHYDMPGMTRDGDVHLAGPRKLAWFSDPDGNILSLMGR
jgi:catechol 2,3-dioxygenase-like lactoylglutathione lyase family enzyme